MVLSIMTYKKHLTQPIIQSYLINSTTTAKKQLTAINAVSSRNLPKTHGVPQESVLGPLLLLIYINYLHKTITNSHVYHFADDTYLLLIDKYPEKLTILSTKTYKNCTSSFRQTKYPPKASKTEIILFKAKAKNVTKNFNFRLSGQKINLTGQLENLELLINNTLLGTAT